MSDATINRFVASGTTAERLAFTPDPPTVASGPNCGYLWWDEDLQTEFAYDFGTAAWVATGGGGSGTVTHTGTLTDHALIVGNGGVDVSALGSLGTTTTVLHGNAAGDPTFGAVDLTADVTGDLPLANLAQASAASKLLGRGSASGAGDFEEISVGTGLSFSGTTLNRSGAGTIRTVRFNFDGTGSALTAGLQLDALIPWNATIQSVTMVADQAGSAVADIWKNVRTSHPPTITDTITAAALPTLTAAATSQDATLTGWTTSVAVNDTLRCTLNSVSTITRLEITLILLET